MGFYDSLLTIFTGYTHSGENIHQLQVGYDGISQATPLDTFKTSLQTALGRGEKHLQQGVHRVIVWLS